MLENPAFPYPIRYELMVSEVLDPFSNLVPLTNGLSLHEKLVGRSECVRQTRNLEARE